MEKARIKAPIVAIFLLITGFLCAQTGILTDKKGLPESNINSVSENIYNIKPVPVDSESNESTKALYKFLLLQFGERIISGQTHNYYSNIKTLTGKSPMLRVGDFQHFTDGYPYLWVDGGHTFGKDDDGSVTTLINWYNSTGKKGILSFQWHWHSPTGGKAGTNTFYTNQTTFDVTKAVTVGTPEYALIIRDIDNIAAELKKFQNANIPVLWRPLHEAGGGWFWWGAKGPQACLKLYNILYDRLKNYHHLHNLIWVWSTPEESWYPGNDKVDIIGYDSYPGDFNYGTQKTMFDQLFNLTKGEKLIAMTENGPIPNPDECLSVGAPWLYFMSWGDLVTSQNSQQHIQAVYDNPKVLTLESNNARTDNYWRSSLYPENWKPGFTDSQGRFLHDFSYAGYHRGEKDVPKITNNIVDITKPPYSADNSGSADVTQIIQNALDNAGKSGGGVIYLPAGKYRIKPPTNSNYSLKISYDKVILRGAGVDSTFIFNDESVMRQKNVILMSNEGSYWFTQRGSVSNISSDLINPTKIIPVVSVTGFNKGDKIIVMSEATDDFIKEHGMDGYWTASSIKGVAFFRQIDSIDVKNKLIFIDSPTRYFLKTRDLSKIYLAGKHLTESGIENLSIGNRQSIKTGWDEETYTETGTGAFDVHYSHVLYLKNCENCWIKNVNTYHPEENSEDFHILSNCLLLDQCSKITVDSCFFQKPQYEGGGGNGYMYTLSSNDCLIKNCRANDGRHNYDFKYPYSNGNVIHNCKGETSKYASDFHMYLSMSNLFDLFTSNKDYLESTFRPYGGSAIHGYSSTQSVFYNTIGEAYHPQHNYIVESKQFGWGFIIGTSGLAFNINIDPAEGSINNYKYNSAPKDFTEGINKGGGLRPQSLYLDQLEKRLNNGVKVQTYNVGIIVKDEKTLDDLPGCKAKNFGEQKITDNFGIVSFDKVPGMLVLSLEKDLYKPLVNKQIIVYSDTILTFFLSKKEYNVIFRVLDNSSKNIIWDAPVKVDEITEQTDNRGEAVFKVFEGIHKYIASDELYKEVTGWVNITSDTLINVYLTQSLANVKFRLKEGTAPVNNAIVRLNTDSLISNALGIVNFYYLSLGSQFSYSISKQGYYYVEGGFILSKDTTIDISMKILDVSAQAVDNNKEFKCWPNPVRDNLNIMLSGTEFKGIISVTNLNGEKLSSLTVKKSNSINLDVSFLPIGIYLIKVVSDDKNLTKLFIKN